MPHFVSSFENSEEARFRCFGSECLVRVSSVTHNLPELLQAAIAEARRIEAKYTRFHESSELSRINREAGWSACLVDQETYALLKLAKHCFEESDGLFDITAAPLLELWAKATSIPTLEQLAAVLSRVDFSAVHLSESEVRFLKPGIKLDLGGLGKEYAVDRVFDLLCIAGADEALVNFGGDLRLKGARPLNIGIQHPLCSDQVLTNISLIKGAIATSGDYARPWIIGGVKYSHIVNPRTGLPCRTLSSVTVVNESALLAGIASTTAILLEESGEDYLREAGVRFFAQRIDGKTIEG